MHMHAHDSRCLPLLYICTCTCIHTIICACALAYTLICVVLNLLIQLMNFVLEEGWCNSPCLAEAKASFMVIPSSPYKGGAGKFFLGFLWQERK